MHMNTATPQKAKLVKIIKGVANILVWVFVAFSVLVTVSVFASLNDSDGVPALGGYCSINILTDSMNPTFKKGDMIIGKKLSDADVKKIKVGDVISYHVDLNDDGNMEINTHRIVEVTTDNEGYVVSVITKGDNKETNLIVDPDPVFCGDIICIWTGTRLAGIGNVIQFLQTSTGFLVIIVLPLIAFFIFELIKFILTINEIRKSGKKEITAADEELIKQQAVEEFLRQQAAEQEAAKAAAKAAVDEEAIKKAAIEEYIRQQAAAAAAAAATAAPAEAEAPAEAPAAPAEAPAEAPAAEASADTPAGDA